MALTRNRGGNKKGVLKNKLEKTMHSLLTKQWGKDKVAYEKFPFTYIKPSTAHTYTPDFVNRDSKLIVETKGRFLIEDRKKMVLIKDGYPDWRVCIFFTSMHRPLYKGSKTTYKAWCDKNGIECSDLKAGLPKDWK
jgi:hypothetical protein